MVKHQLVFLVLLFYSVFILFYRIADVLVVIKLETFRMDGTNVSCRFVIYILFVSFM